MSHAKQASKGKRRSKAVPVLGAAGLSLSLASGASAASGGAAAEVLTRNTGVTHEITLREEEICDVSLATFYVFDKDSVGTLRPRLRLAAGGGCGGGCPCGSPPVDVDYGTPTPSSANPPYRSIRPSHKYTHAPKRTHVSKKP
jgi:hypothetical protein